MVSVMKGNGGFQHGSHDIKIYPCFKVVVASGDSGANGAFLTAAPATGRNVISTGSVDNRLVAAHVLDIKGLSHGSIGK